MDKKTVLAVVLLSVLFTIFLVVGQLSNSGETVTTEQSEQISSNETTSRGPLGGVETTSPIKAVNAGGLPRAEKHQAETELFEIEFSTLGASITSLQLKGYSDKGKPLQMVQKGGSEDWGAFLLYFSADNQGAPFYGPYSFTDKGNGQFEFQANASVNVGGESIPFSVIKTYTFVPDEYMFEVKVSLIQPDGQYLPLNFSGYSYALEAGPQIGPKFTKLDGQQVYRKPVYYNGRKSKLLKLGSKPLVLDERVIWAGIDEKYFALIGVPDESSYRELWTSKSIKSATGEGVEDGTQLSFVRSQIRSSRQEDRFYFYVGPKQNKELSRYDRADRNEFGLSSLNLEGIAPNMPLFGWLESIFKVSLAFIYRFVPNWGWSIVILTILVKLILFPLTLKSLLSTARLADLQPKIKIIQEKYKDDPTEMQKAQFELYQREGINPMAGCLPMLFQLPIFIALYNLFNKFFDLRGAHFFGWITDLSAPDVVMSFAHPLPVLGWTGLHMLPVIYLVSQFLMNKVMQSDSTAQNSQMRTVMWIMPFMFFFIFYGVASALLVYWIMSNILSIVQQMLISYLKKTGHLRAGGRATEAKHRKNKYANSVRRG